MKVALNELEKYIKDGKHLETGKPFKNFQNLRSREILANWLICAALNHGAAEKFSFTSDSDGDGIIWDAESKNSWPTEHILISNRNKLPASRPIRRIIIPGLLRQRLSASRPPFLKTEVINEIENLILESIKKKRNKGGHQYASGKTLVVFLNANGESWLPNKVTRLLPTPLHFDTVWVVGLQYVRNNEYVYGVTNLNIAKGNAPTWLIYIAEDFNSWRTEIKQ